VIRLSNAWEYNGINVMLRKGSVNLIKDICNFVSCMFLNTNVK
jgi:hypothetical protein